MPSIAHARLNPVAVQVKGTKIKGAWETDSSKGL
jgi:hypothetical protein